MSTTVSPFPSIHLLAESGPSEARATSVGAAAPPLRADAREGEVDLEAARAAPPPDPPGPLVAAQAVPMSTKMIAAARARIKISQ
jgi:hypothetical protein